MNELTRSTDHGVGDKGRLKRIAKGHHLPTRMIDFRVRGEGVLQFALKICCALGGQFRQVNNGGLGRFMQRVERLVMISKGRVGEVFIFWRAAGELRRRRIHH